MKCLKYSSSDSVSPWHFQAIHYCDDLLLVKDVLSAICTSTCMM